MSASIPTEAWIGAMSALEVLDEMLGEYLTERGIEDTDNVLSLQDVRRIIRTAREALNERNT